MRNISTRAKLAPPSPIRKLALFAQEAKKAGRKVFHLNIGQPDIAASEALLSGIKSCLNSSYLPYEGSKGREKLVSNWVKYLKSEDISIKPENLLITSGGSEGLVMALAAVANPKDEVLVFEPFYANYLGFANMVSAKIVPKSLDEKNGYHLPSEQEIVGKISLKTRAIIITNPNNPTGTVFAEKELKLILKIAKKYDLFIISDEAYSGICFDGAKSKSIFYYAPAEEKQRIIIIDSLSKKFNVCGARIGALISVNLELNEVFNRFSQQRLSVATIDQIITEPLLLEGKKYINKIACEYEKRRDAFISALEKNLETKINYPEGAFYTMVRLPIKDTDHFAKWMLTDFQYENETVMVAPGSGFYATAGKGKNEIRVAFVLNVPDLKRAAKVLAEGVKQYLELRII